MGKLSKALKSRMSARAKDVQAELLKDAGSVAREQEAMDSRRSLEREVDPNSVVREGEMTQKESDRMISKRRIKAMRRY